ARAQRLGHDLFLRLQPAVRVLPEFRHLLAGARRASDPCAACRDDARAAGPRLPQHQLRHPGACRPADHPGATPRHRSWAAAAQPTAAPPPRSTEAGAGRRSLYTPTASTGRAGLAVRAGCVTISLPPLKTGPRGPPRRYLRMPGYPPAARQAVLEMNRQVGLLR